MAETALDVAERIRALLRHVPADKLWLNPDCGVWETPRWVVKQKVGALVQGAEIVRKELGGVRRILRGRAHARARASAGPTRC